MPVTKLAHARPPDSKMFRPYIWVSACRAPAKHNMYNTPELGWGHHSCGGVGQIGRYTQSARRISWKTKFPVNAMCKSIAWETSLTPVGNRVLVQDINVKPLQVGAAEVEYKWWMSCNVTVKYCVTQACELFIKWGSAFLAFPSLLVWGLSGVRNIMFVW